MKKILFTIGFGIIVIFANPILLHAADTLHVISHNKAIVKTNPKRGFNNYPAIAVFPDNNVSFRKVTLFVTLQCPDGLMCGEWDYSDGIYLVPSKSVKKSSCNDTLEIGRILTPYGRFYGPEWKFTFNADISDFASLLHDSATVIYKHTGYEPSDDRGWKITLDFELITGPPVAECIDIIPLWNGNFVYGDSVRNIEADLHPVEVTKTSASGSARLWIIQTGHGMDQTENCAEFCYKYRDVLFDNNIVDHRLIKKECASNPLYHQAGTWIYDRANWCPGDMVQPECYTYPTTGKPLTVDINMQPYVADTGKVSACYSFSSYLMLYKKPKAKYDVAMEHILMPSSDDMYRHDNPSVKNGRIVIRNNGAVELKSLMITYGFKGEPSKTFHWAGTLKFGNKETVIIPEAVVSENNNRIFLVTLSKPNGKKDEYTADNTMVSEALHIPVFPGKFICSYKTNNDTAQTSWSIVNRNGETIFSRSANQLKPNTAYADTIQLQKGFYELVVSDTAGDGLEFWANPEGGMGYFRLLAIDGRILKLFQSDFGNEIIQAFKVDENDTSVDYETEEQVSVYPQRTKGKTQLFLLLNKAADVSVSITSGEKILLEQSIGVVKEHTVDFDLTNFGPGIYQMNVKWGNNSKNIRIKIPENK